MRTWDLLGSKPVYTLIETTACTNAQLGLPEDEVEPVVVEEPVEAPVEEEGDTKPLPFDPSLFETGGPVDDDGTTDSGSDESIPDFPSGFGRLLNDQSTMFQANSNSGDILDSYKD